MTDENQNECPVGECLFCGHDYAEPLMEHIMSQDHIRAIKLLYQARQKVLGKAKEIADTEPGEELNPPETQNPKPRNPRKRKLVAR